MRRKLADDRGMKRFRDPARSSPVLGRRHASLKMFFEHHIFRVGEKDDVLLHIDADEPQTKISIYDFTVFNEAPVNKGAGGGTTDRTVNLELGDRRVKRTEVILRQRHNHG